MFLDFDENDTEKNIINLMNCQIDMILRSLEFYAYTYQFIYPQSKKNKSKEENLRVSLVRDTYHQIASQYYNSKHARYTNKYFSDFEKNIEKVA